MRDTKPGRILAEESENPWVKLILWSNEENEFLTRRWNGFIRHVVESRLAVLERLGLTDEEQRAFMEDCGTERADFKQVVQLPTHELNEAKKFFPGGTNFTKLI